VAIWAFALLNGAFKILIFAFIHDSLLEKKHRKKKHATKKETGHIRGPPAPCDILLKVRRV